MNREIKKSLRQFLINDWVWKGDMLFHTPINDILIAFYFEKSPSKKGQGYYLWSFVQPLCIPREHIFFTFGKRIETNNGNQFWKTKELLDRLPLVINILSENLLKYADIHSLAKKNNTKQQKSLRELEVSIFLWAEIDFDISIKLYTLFNHEVNLMNNRPIWVNNLSEELKSFISLNKIERTNFLNQTRANTAKNLDLTKFLK